MGDGDILHACILRACYMHVTCYTLMLTTGFLNSSAMHAAVSRTACGQSISEIFLIIRVNSLLVRESVVD